MSTDQTKRKELYWRWIEALNARDLSQLQELAEEMNDKDSILHDPGFPDLGRGPAAALEGARLVLKDWPDIHITLEDFFGEGDKTAVRMMVRATSASTGKTVSFPVLAIDHWAGNKAVESWELASPPEEQA
jgi:hypothetical protein